MARPSAGLAALSGSSCVCLWVMVPWATSHGESQRGRGTRFVPSPAWSVTVSSTLPVPSLVKLEAVDFQKIPQLFYESVKTSIFSTP